MPWIADSQTKNPSYHCLSSIHTHLDAPSFLIGYKPNSVVSKVNLITCDPLVIILTSLCPDRRNQSWFTQIKLQPLPFVILLCWPRSLISPSRFVIKSTQPWGVVTVECRGRCDVPIRNLTIFDTNWHRVTSCIRKWYNLSTGNPKRIYSNFEIFRATKQSVLQPFWLCSKITLSLLFLIYFSKASDTFLWLFQDFFHTIYFIFQAKSNESNFKSCAE